MWHQNNLPNENAEVHSPDGLSQTANDEQTADPREMTGPQMNIIIAYQPNHHGERIPTWYCWFIAVLFLLVIYGCWPFMIFAFIAYRLIVGDDQSAVIPRRSRSRQLTLPPPYCYGWMRDAQEEGRVASPVNYDIRLSGTVQMATLEPLAIQNTQPHDAAMLVDPNNLQQADATVDNQNNEVATLNAHNEMNVQNTTDGDLNDHRTHNIGSRYPIESEDDARSSESSGEESDPIISSDSDADGNDENNPADDVGQRGQASPITRENLSTLIPSTVGSNQTNIVGGQPTTTDLPPLQREATEIERNAGALIEGARPARAPFFCLTGTLIPKTRNRAYSSGESSDEQAV